MPTINDTLKILAETGVEIAGDLVDAPIAGYIGDTLISLLWPDSSTDVWEQVQNDVATLLNETIDQTIYTQLSLKLSGLLGVYANYINSLKSGDLGTIKDNWTAAHDQFTADSKGFQQPGPFVPLFVQVVNLQLALLKDGVENGLNWNWQPVYVDQIHQELKEAIYDSTHWVESAYSTGLLPLSTPPPGIGGSSTAAAVWQQQNVYVRAMVLTVWDFVFLWPYFDPDSHAPSPLPANTREIYSDLIGGFTNNPIGQAIDSGTAPALPTLPAPVVTDIYNPYLSPQSPNYSSSAPVSIQWNQSPKPAVSSITTWVQYTPNNAGSPWVYTLFSAQVSRAGAPNPDPMTGAQPALGTPSSWSTMPVTSARGGFGGGNWPYINWIQLVSNDDLTNVSPVIGNLYGSNYNETWAGPQPFVFTYPLNQLSNLLFTQVAEPDPPHNIPPMPVAVIFGFRLSNSYLC